MALLPGVAFGCSNQELTAQLAYVDFDGARALAAAEATPIDMPLEESFLRDYCGTVVQAIDLIGDWFTGSR